MLCGVPTLIISPSTKYVRCSPSRYTFFLSSVPTTFHVVLILRYAWLCLGFKTKLRILQIPAWKMKPKIGFFVYFACACVCSRNLSTLIHGPSLNINLAKLASSSVALLAELVLYHFSKCSIQVGD